MDVLAFTIRQFCESHNIGRSRLFELWKEGEGPAVMVVGRKRLISVEAAAEWRRRMEAKAETSR